MASSCFKVAVRDDGDNIQLSADEDALICVDIDLSITAPSVASNIILTSLNETVSNNTEVAQVQGAISYGPGFIMYSLLDDYDNTFRIDELDGKIYTNKNLNYDDIKTYKLTVTLMNSHDKSKTTSAMLDIDVLNENSHRPEFTHSPIETSIDDSFPVGGIITMIHAADKDQSEIVKYKITNGNEDGYFNINSFGALLLLKSLDADSKQFHSLIIVAVDNGEPESESLPLNVKINVKSANVVTKPEVKINMSEIFPTRYEEYDVELQADFTNDEDFNYYSTLPRISWFDVNYKGDFNKNEMRKYLAYTYIAEVTEQNQTRRRRREVSTDSNSEDPDTFKFVVGAEGECEDTTSVNVPCNAPPLLKDVQFKYYVTGRTNGTNFSPKEPTFNAGGVPSATSSTSQANQYKTKDRPNVLYIIGLVVLGTLLAICLVTICLLIIYFAPLDGSMFFKTIPIRLPRFGYKNLQKKFPGKPSIVYRRGKNARYVVRSEGDMFLYDEDDLRRSQAMFEQQQRGMRPTDVYFEDFEPDIVELPDQDSYNGSDNSRSFEPFYVKRASRYNRPIYQVHSNSTSSSTSSEGSVSSWSRNLLGSPRDSPLVQSTIARMSPSLTIEQPSPLYNDSPISILPQESQLVQSTIFRRSPIYEDETFGVPMNRLNFYGRPLSEITEEEEESDIYTEVYEEEDDMTVATTATSMDQYQHGSTPYHLIPRPITGPGHEGIDQLKF